MTEKTIPAVTYTAGSGTAAVGGATLLGMTHDEWALVAILVGIATSVAAFALNAWFQWDRRQREIMAAGGKK